MACRHGSISSRLRWQVAAGGPSEIGTAIGHQFQAARGGSETQLVHRKGLPWSENEVERKLQAVGLVVDFEAETYWTVLECLGRWVAVTSDELPEKNEHRINPTEDILANRLRWVLAKRDQTSWYTKFVESNF